MHDPKPFKHSEEAQAGPGFDSEALISQLCDEYSNALRNGEQVSIESFVSKFPELEELLRPALSAVKVLMSLVGHDHQPIPESLVGDFRILRRVACGGMGIVYQAEQLSTGRIVALKVLKRHSDDGTDAARIVRFENEVRASASLDHPHIVPLYSVELAGRYHFYAMRWIDGFDWGSWKEYLHSVPC